MHHIPNLQRESHSSLLKHSPLLHSSLGALVGTAQAVACGGRQHCALEKQLVTRWI
jgi:hypothetical protein